MLCMTPLDGWVGEAMAPAGFWMYRGVARPPPLHITHENTNSPASWFMMSEAGSVVATRWRDATHAYWAVRETTTDYFWMDGLFRELLQRDPEFRDAWACVPYLSCEDYGQAHMLNGRALKRVAPFVVRTLRLHPPFALKLTYKGWPAAPREDAAVFVALKSAFTRRIVGRNHSKHKLGGVGEQCFVQRPQSEAEQGRGGEGEGGGGGGGGRPGAPVGAGPGSGVALASWRRRRILHMLQAEAAGPGRRGGTDGGDEGDASSLTADAAAAVVVVDR